MKNQLHQGALAFGTLGSLKSFFHDLDLGVLSVTISRGENVTYGPGWFFKVKEWKLGMVSLLMVLRIVFTGLFIRSSGGTVDGKNQETSWSSINSRIMSSLFADFQTCANYIQHTRPYFHQTGEVKNIIIITVVHLGTNPLRECVLKNTYWTTVICQWSDTQFNPMGIQVLYVPCTFDLMFNPSKTWSEMLIHFLKYHWSPMLS